eukprot:6476650-Amphidinium_carterae.1
MAGGWLTNLRLMSTALRARRVPSHARTGGFCSRSTGVEPNPIGEMDINFTTELNAYTVLRKNPGLQCYPLG